MAYNFFNARYMRLRKHKQAYKYIYIYKIYKAQITDIKIHRSGNGYKLQTANMNPIL